MRRKKPKYTTAEWHVKGIPVPVQLHLEWRRSRRVSIGKKAVIVRMPLLDSNHDGIESENWAKSWLELQLTKNPAVFDHFKPKIYRDGDQFHTTHKKYLIQLSRENRKTAVAKCIQNNIYLKIPIISSDISESKMIHSLLGRILSADNISWVKSKIQTFNDQYFQSEIKSIRLKNNKSNWGSCSSSGNINISVRLLFAPEEVQDYVFIHELAHLKELNHTRKFWKIVEDIMPDYKQKERWLKNNSHLCNF